MKWLVLLFVCISMNVSGQWKDYFLSVKGDTLNRVDLEGKKQGPWLLKVPDLRGERGYEEEGYFTDDQKEGLWKRYSLQGIKIAEENYRWGKLSGKQKYYTYNGGLLRLENWRAIDPKISYDTVSVYDLKDPTKEIDRVVVKNEGFSLKNGEWIYYDPEWGRVEAIEHYVMGKLQTEDGSLLGDDEIRPIDISKNKSDSLAKANDPAMKMIKEYEKKNSGKKKIKVRDGNTGN